MPKSGTWSVTPKKADDEGLARSRARLCISSFVLEAVTDRATAEARGVVTA